METTHSGLQDGKSEGERSLDELEELAATAGVGVVGKVLQKRALEDPAFFIGRGKVEEITRLLEDMEANVLIFDDELSGAQLRNIEEMTRVKVIDRTMLILDIFARRAKSREGKLQVELAQLKYRLPRLIGLGGQLSRLGGGIGTRGPGETKLEVDRRHIRRRIKFLENELMAIGRRRDFAREGRKRYGFPVAALVGYTNAGKSTLMNKLCGSDLFAEDRLFATLDPSARKLNLPDGRDVLLIDTVGFIRKLPHELVEAFKSTLEEAVYADILLHVVDASHEEAESQAAIAGDILESLGALNKPVILVFNKVDLAGEAVVTRFTGRGERAFEVSAVTGQGLDRLVQGIADLLPAELIKADIMVPYEEGWILSYLYENGTVTDREYIGSGVKVRAEIDKIKIERIKNSGVKVHPLPK